MILELKNPMKKKSRFEIRPLPDDIESEDFETPLKEFIMQYRDESKKTVKNKLLSLFYEKYVGRVVIQVNLEFMKNVSIVDTPGEGENDELSKLVSQKLAESNVVVLVTDVSRAQFSKLDRAHTRDLKAEFESFGREGGDSNTSILPLDQRLLIVGNKVDLMVPEKHRKPSPGGKGRRRRKKTNVEESPEYYEGFVRRSRKKMLENINKIDTFGGLIKEEQVFATCCDVEETFGMDVYDVEFVRLRLKAFEMTKDVMFKLPLSGVFEDAMEKSEVFWYIWKQESLMKKYLKEMKSFKTPEKAETKAKVLKEKKSLLRSRLKRLRASIEKNKVCDIVCEEDIPKPYINAGGWLSSTIFGSTRDEKAVRYIMNKTSTVVCNTIRDEAMKFSNNHVLQQLTGIGINRPFILRLFGVEAKRTRFKYITDYYSRKTRPPFRNIEGYWDLFPQIGENLIPTRRSFLFGGHREFNSLIRKVEFDKDWRENCFNFVWKHLEPETLISYVMKRLEVRTSEIIDGIIKKSQKVIHPKFLVMKSGERTLLRKRLMDSYFGLRDLESRYIREVKLSSPLVLSGENSCGIEASGTVACSWKGSVVDSHSCFKVFENYWKSRYLLMDVNRICDPDVSRVSNLFVQGKKLCLVREAPQRSEALFEVLIKGDAENTTISQRVEYMKELLLALHVSHGDGRFYEDLSLRKIYRLVDDTFMKKGIWGFDFREFCSTKTPRNHIQWNLCHRDSAEYYSRLLQPGGFESAITRDVFSFGVIFAKVWECTEDIRVELVESFEGYKVWKILIDENKHGEVMGSKIGKYVAKIVERCTSFERGKCPSVSEVLKWVEEIVRIISDTE